MSVWCGWHLWSRKKRFVMRRGISKRRARELNSTMKERKKQTLRDREEFNALFNAIMTKNVALVRQKLATGSNPDAYADAKYATIHRLVFDGQSALYLAVVTRQTAIVVLLLKAGANPNSHCGMGEKLRTALMCAASNNDLAATRIILEAGANVNAKATDGQTALLFAAEKGFASIVQLLVDYKVDLDAQDGNMVAALHLVAYKGYVDVARILLASGAAVDIKTAKGYTPAKMALLWMQVPTLELLLRYGADAHAAAVLPDMHPYVVTEAAKKHVREMLNALKEQPTIVYLLADHGGICEKGGLNIQVANRGDTSVTRALRQVGSDAWCDGGHSLIELSTKHRTNGIQLLGSELVGHTLQLRLRPWQVAKPDAPLNLVIGDRVVLHSLKSAAMNDEYGIIAGALGAQKEGRYSVKLQGGGRNVQIKASNLRPRVDPGRAAVSGHTVDSLQSIVLGGATGGKAFCNGVYNLNPAHTANTFPVLTHATDANQHLFCGNEGCWIVADTPTMVAGRNAGWIASNAQSPSPLGLQWGIGDGTGKIVSDPAVTLHTPTWINGSPPDDWILRDTTVESFNEESHEHKLVFNNLERTSLHLRLDYFQFLDWDVLPRRRAAMLAPRAVVTALMVLNRMEDGRVSKDAVLPPSEVGGRDTPVLRVFFGILMRSTIDFAPIFREFVWKSVAAPVSLVERGRVEDLRIARAAEKTAAAAAAARSASARRGKKKKKGKKARRKK